MSYCGRSTHRFFTAFKWPQECSSIQPYIPCRYVPVRNSAPLRSNTVPHKCDLGAPHGRLSATVGSYIFRPSQKNRYSFPRTILGPSGTILSHQGLTSTRCAQCSSAQAAPPKCKIFLPKGSSVSHLLDSKAGCADRHTVSSSLKVRH